MPDGHAPPPGSARILRAPRQEDGAATRLLEDVRLAFAPATYDAEAGEVDVVWSTGVAVRRYDWWSGEYYDEELDLAGADLARLQAGAPLLLDHWSSVRNLVGSVAPGSVKVERGQGTARLRFDRSGEEGQMAEAKVAGGHLRHVSIGYRVQTWEKVEAQGQVPRWIARAWEPFEISLVPVPADAGAGTRAVDGGPNPPPQSNRAPGAPIPEGQMADETTQPDANAAEKPDDIRKAERARVAEIRRRARSLGLAEPLIDEMCDGGLTVEAAAIRMTDELAKRTPTPPPANPRAEIGQDHTDPAAVRDAMAQAIAAANQPSFKPTNARAAAPPIAADLSLGGLMVGMPAYGGVVLDNALHGMLDLQMACHQRGIPFGYITVRNESLVQRARNRCVAEFLAQPGYSHLLFVDADVGFTADAVFRLLAHDVPLIGGLYRRKTLTASDWCWNRLAPDQEKRNPATGAISCAAVGTGFLLIRRDVINRMIRATLTRRKKGGPLVSPLRYLAGPGEPGAWREHTYALFDCWIDETGNYLSEDFAFCRRWRDLGGDVWADPAVQLSHSGTATFEGDAWGDLR
ncbi:HK97 family phage prohead protease [Falsiroseomonas selenitidurans]|uniref:Prohead serine protease domain-containing protein n=1 Tax=Falsiroseomonas selenitidurans TaxID=2716335 RepID=A0ABX1E9J2_9PROT|nr:HK97 family phage prohead protease [Falsiroseomonas selenitidurans]NKC33493.1 hypothetical protein [Falsiroseomonas selenitidurans]